MKIPVYFCLDIENNEVVAIFTDITLNPVYDPFNRRVCYAHMGQHGECDLGWIEEKTQPATPAQYGPLLSELRRMYDRDGDTLDVRPALG